MGLFNNLPFQTQQVAWDSFKPPQMPMGGGGDSGGGDGLGSLLSSISGMLGSAFNMGESAPQMPTQDMQMSMPQSTNLSMPQSNLQSIAMPTMGKGGATPNITNQQPTLSNLPISMASTQSDFPALSNVISPPSQNMAEGSGKDTNIDMNPMGGFNPQSQPIVNQQPQQVNPYQNVNPTIRSQIEEAAKATGVPVEYLMTTANIESGFKPTEKSSTSAATGLYQFMPATFKGMVKEYGKQYGITNDDLHNPRAQAIMAGQFAKDNGNLIKTSLGVDPTPTDMYMGHFLGPQQATKFIRQNFVNPDVPVTQILPANVLQANRGVFFNKGKPRTVGEVYDIYDQKFTSGKQVQINNAKQRNLPTGYGATLKTVQPVLQDKAQAIIDELKAQGFDPIIASGDRTLDQQKINLKKGNSQTLNSRHLTGQALDIVDRRYGWDKGNKADREKFWNALGEAATKQGLEWGGNWKSFRDTAHIQMPRVKKAP